MYNNRASLKLDCPPKRLCMHACFLTVSYALDQMKGFLVLCHVSLAAPFLFGYISPKAATHGENSPSLCPTMSSVMVTSW